MEKHTRLTHSAVKRRIVIALGGNALLTRSDEQTIEAQQKNIKRACAVLATMVAQGHEIVVTHGNGPQVGRLANQSYAYDPEHTDPLDVLGAQSEGLIGYLIEQALANVLPRQARCVTILTRVEVNADDPAFNEPTKPIGPFLNSQEAQQMRKQGNWSVKDYGGQYRRVVASPMPQRILEIDAIRLLVDSGFIAICGGGGGVPVVRNQDATTRGVEAVIDKDMTSSLLAKKLGADMLLLLTDVPGVYSHWGTERAEILQSIELESCNLADYESGSIKPKIAAAAAFVATTEGSAIIGSLEKGLDMLTGKAGTRIFASKRSDQR